jgi:hypothetical protein
MTKRLVSISFFFAFPICQDRCRVGLVRLIDLGRFGSSYGVSEVFRRTEANVG